jgi:hypothetical protein
MSVSWEKAQKRLQELQKRLPEPLLVELTYYDDSTEVLTLEEILKKNNEEWKKFRVVNGNNVSEATKLLDWIAPDSVIE